MDQLIWGDEMVWNVLDVQAQRMVNKEQWSVPKKNDYNSYLWFVECLSWKNLFVI